jgi:hypothetical protein
MSREPLDPDTPLSFKQAAKICLNGLVSESTLRAAWYRGELSCERLGRRVVTTPRAIAEWRASKRVVAQPPKRYPTIDEINPIDPFEHAGISPERQRELAQEIAQDSLDALRNGSAKSPNSRRGKRRPKR